MKGYSEKLRDGLLNEETMTGSYRDTYKKEVRMLLETTISPRRKAGIVFLAICIGVQAVFLAYRAFITAPADTFPRIIYTLSALFTGFLSGYLIIMVRKNKLNNKTHPRMIVTVFFFFALVFMLTALLGSWAVGHDNIGVAVFIAMCGFFVFLMATLGLVFYQIKQTELKMYEKLLRMELRIAELGENIPKQIAEIN